MASNRRSVTLRWQGEGQQFEGGSETSAPILVDGDSGAGPSPMEALLLAVAGCMAIDVRMILEKSRVPLESLEVRVEGDRASDVPKRFTAIRMRFELAGPQPEHAGRVERAIRLSKEKYCSVQHSLRPDIAVETDFELAASA